MAPDIKLLPRVFTGSNFVILDVSGLLPHHPNFPHASKVVDPRTNKPFVAQGRGYYTVAGRNITHVITHQTAGGYAEAWTQLIDTATFFVRDPGFKPNRNGVFGWTGRGRGWPGFAYTWLVPFAPYTLDGKHAVWQCNPLDLVTWHTGDGMNEHGGGLAFQGHFLGPDTPTPMKGTDGHPSDAQQEVYPAFWLEYAVPVLGASTLTMHSEHGKVGCPGYDLEYDTRIIRGY